MLTWQKRLPGTTDDIWRLKPRRASENPFYLIPGIAIAREEQKTLVVSTANVALQDQIYSKDLPLLRKIIPELRFTAAFGRGRYVCPRNLAALASSEPTQQDLLAFLDDELTPNNKAEQDRCAKLKADLDSYKWDGLRDPSPIRRLTTTCGAGSALIKPVV